MFLFFPSSFVRLRVPVHILLQSDFCLGFFFFNEENFYSENNNDCHPLS